MAIKPVAQLKSQAQLIKNETTPSANTATRIGQELLDVVDTFAAEITGHPPYIGENGVWYQWDMELSQYASTEVVAKGDTGDTGKQGPKGDTGSTGNKGETGSSGVAVSETAPTDPDVKVWLKPDGEAPEFATKSDLTGKADLEPATKTVLPAQISPLQGRQTGVNATDGMYKSTAAALLFKGSRTVEALIKLGPNPPVVETVFDMRGDGSNIRIDIGPNNMIKGYSGGSFTQIQGIEGEYYHIVIRLDSDNNSGTLFINGVHRQTINSNINYPIYFNIGGYALVGSNKFRGIINNLRTFNYPLSDNECLSLWNGGRPNGYMVAGIGSMRDGLVGEYLPCGLLTDKWRDTSGNGNDIAAVGTPKLSYETVPDMSEITIDTGVFYTDITLGVTSKVITVPVGYYVEKVIVRNFNTGGLTAISAVNGYNNYYFLSNASINMVGGRDIAVSGGAYASSTGVLTATPMIYTSKSSTPITITATGNTANGGMRVKLICKYIGV